MDGAWGSAERGERPGSGRSESASKERLDFEREAEQDLRIYPSRIPAMPRSRFVIGDVRRIGWAADGKGGPRQRG